MLHSLGIAKVIQFNPGAKILDVGTGGGFPGIPLLYVSWNTFYLIDIIAKKIKVVNEVAQGLGLKNVRAEQRAELVKNSILLWCKPWQALPCCYIKMNRIDAAATAAHYGSVSGDLRSRVNWLLNAASASNPSYPSKSYSWTLCIQL